jgi:hypothetical protein
MPCIGKYFFTTFVLTIMHEYAVNLKRLIQNSVEYYCVSVIIINKTVYSV